MCLTCAYQKTFLCVIFLLAPAILFSQELNSKSPAGPASGFLGGQVKEQFNLQYPEKAYLQFDKPYYAIGDTINFKAYVTLGAENKLSALSGILHAELISPENGIIRELRLQITVGTAAGDFVLTDTLKSGNYRVRAYTNWMRNEGDDASFEKVIPVGGTEVKRIPESGEPAAAKKTAAKKITNKTDIQFLPEGGSFIAGNYSKIAFKAIGPDGLGKDVKGIVTDDTGEEVCRFETGHAGMGSFTFVPKEDQLYKAVITSADGTNTTIALPKTESKGYTLSLNNTDPDTVRIRITGGNDSPMQKLSLVASACGKVYYVAENASINKFFSAVIPKSKFPPGIVQFTLLSQTGEPLNERLVFIDNHKGIGINLTPGKQIYTARQKVNMGLSARTGDNKASTGSFSVAIINEDKVPTDTLNETTILTNLLLTADLKGTIESPGYYFANQSEKTKADLDNLLLTQGYRHFSWRQMADSASLKYHPENAITISGAVKRNNKPVPDAKVKLFSKTGGVFMLDTVTDVNGKFAFKDLIFADSTKFLVQSKVKKGQDDVTLELDTVRPPRLNVKTYNTDRYAETSVSVADISNYVINQKQFYQEQQKYGINKHAVILREVKVKAKKEPPIIPHSQNLNGAGNADHILTAKDIERFICGKLSDCLQGVYGLKFKNGLPELGAVIIDGTFVDKDVFTQLNPDDIEGIEIINGAHYGAIYGSRMAGGGLIITTKPARRTDNIYYRYAPGVIAYMPKGFYKAREFYSPQYDNPHTNQKMADLRSTIYWNPNIITDKDGKASFSYFNADGKGTYRLVIEGIDADGNLGRQVLRYKVD